MLVDFDIQITDERIKQQELGWTAFQLSNSRAFQSMQKNRNRWQRYESSEERTKVEKAFHDYAYQWF